MSSFTNYAIAGFAGAASGVITYLAIDDMCFVQNVDSVSNAAKFFTGFATMAVGSGLGVTAVVLTRDNSYKKSLLGGALTTLIVPITVLALKHINNCRI